MTYRSKDNETIETIAGFIIFLIVATLIFFKFWVIGSVITSGIKAVTENCNETYVVERILSGHWFCPDEEI